MQSKFQEKRNIAWLSSVLEGWFSPTVSQQPMDETGDILHDYEYLLPIAPKKTAGVAARPPKHCPPRDSFPVLESQT